MFDAGGVPRHPRGPDESSAPVAGIRNLVDDLEPDGLGRNETTLERADRNLVELLQEVRVVQTGVQVLFGFLLMAPLTAGFHRLGSVLQREYFVTLLLAAAGAILLIAPTAYHRLLFRRGDKEYLVRVANRLTIAGLAAVGLAMVGSIAFVAGILFPRETALVIGSLACFLCVLLWAVLPLRRRRVCGPADPRVGRRLLKGSSTAGPQAGVSQAAATRADIARPPSVTSG
jgi:hypothetical protein